MPTANKSADAAADATRTALDEVLAGLTAMIFAELAGTSRTRFRQIERLARIAQRLVAAAPAGEPRADAFGGELAEVLVDEGDGFPGYDRPIALARPPNDHGDMMREMMMALEKGLTMQFAPKPPTALEQAHELSSLVLTRSNGELSADERKAIDARITAITSRMKGEPIHALVPAELSRGHSTDGGGRRDARADAEAVGNGTRGAREAPQGVPQRP